MMLSASTKHTGLLRLLIYFSLISNVKSMEIGDKINVLFLSLGNILFTFINSLYDYYNMHNLVRGELLYNGNNSYRMNKSISLEILGLLYLSNIFIAVFSSNAL